ncbi:MAG: aconitase X catalytic domain-containing protein [Hyphomicrobiales bacterium]|jgi:predicted aconitase|nr:aconitase X catalytic domain-containing protein [Hyphomicrobiales bacterium]
MTSLTRHESATAAGADGAAMAMRIVAESARLLGAPRLICVQSAHIDGALYHGDAGTLFAEELVRLGAKVAIRATLNVGALDLMGCSKSHLSGARRDMAKRLMLAYEAMGCEKSWTCAPYQAGHRPALGSDVAWGESNAVAFCNSVLGARTNRYGDYLDIACAITGRAPDCGLHRAENRLATVIVDVSGLPAALFGSDWIWPVLGTLYGREIGTSIGIVSGVTGPVSEDKLKAFGAAAASSGGVGLFHIAGVTPEAPDVVTATGGRLATRITVTPAMVHAAQAGLSTIHGAASIDAVAIGSPHLSLEELESVGSLLASRPARVPIYACTGRHVVREADRTGLRKALEKLNVIVVADTCVVVTPILPDINGVLMTNSGKFAHYAPGNTGYDVVYGSLSDCIESAIAGRPVITNAALRP